MRLSTHVNLKRLHVLLRDVCMYVCMYIYVYMHIYLYTGHAESHGNLFCTYLCTMCLMQLLFTFHATIFYVCCSVLYLGRPGRLQLPLCPCAALCLFPPLAFPPNPLLGLPELSFCISDSFRIDLLYNPTQAPTWACASQHTLPILSSLSLALASPLPWRVVFLCDFCVQRCR